MLRPVSSETLFESHSLDQPEKARATAHADVLAVVDPFLGGTVVKRSRTTAQAESRFEQQGGTSLGCQPHCSRQAGQSAPDDDRWRFCAVRRRGWGWGKHHSDHCNRPRQECTKQRGWRRRFVFEREGCEIAAVSRGFRVVRMVGAGEARELTGVPR